MISFLLSSWIIHEFANLFGKMTEWWKWNDTITTEISLLVLTYVANIDAADRTFSPSITAVQYSHVYQFSLD